MTAGFAARRAVGLAIWLLGALARWPAGRQLPWVRSPADRCLPSTPSPDAAAAFWPPPRLRLPPRRRRLERERLGAESVSASVAVAPFSIWVDPESASTVAEVCSDVVFAARVLWARARRPRYRGARVVAFRGRLDRDRQALASSHQRLAIADGCVVAARGLLPPPVGCVDLFASS